MSTIFDLKIQVQPEHIDVLGHVNNVVYIQWMQDVAESHIETLGLGLAENTPSQWVETSKINLPPMPKAESLLPYIS